MWNQHGEFLALFSLTELNYIHHTFGLMWWSLWEGFIVITDPHLTPLFLSLSRELWIDKIEKYMARQTAKIELKLNKMSKSLKFSKKKHLKALLPLKNTKISLQRPFLALCSGD